MSYESTTPNLGLPQWVLSDPPQMNDFNSAFSNIDTFAGTTNTAVENIWETIYPVNSIYISYSHTSPASLFGGSWTRIASRFLYACTASDTIGGTGGESTHTLTTAEMPSHTHAFTIWDNVASNQGAKVAATNSNATPVSTTTPAYTGGGGAHNNMPPYINVAIWRRTA